MEPSSVPSVTAGWSVGISGSRLQDDRITHVEHVWGTAVSIALVGTRGREGAALDLIRQCTEMFIRVDETFSTYKPLSEVSLYRSGVERPGQQSEEFDEVLATCRDLRSATRGAFDPWSVAGGFDPSGYVKGWAARRARDLVVGGDFTDVLINAGGDVCAIGDEVPGSTDGWPVGIVNPSKPSEVIEVVHLRNQSMATSGRYERGDHVVDPASGLSVIAVDSATAVGPDPGVADAIATAAMVDGHRSLKWLEDFGPQWSLHVVVGKTAYTHGTQRRKVGSIELHGSCTWT